MGPRVHRTAKIFSADARGRTCSARQACQRRSCRHSPVSPTRPAAPTMTANAPRANATTPALICLVCRRVEVTYAMLRDRTPYQQPTPTEPGTRLAAA